MTTRIHKLNFAIAIAAAALLLSATSAQAVILGPYTPNGNTLHLWHLNESANTSPTVDAVGGANKIDLNATTNNGGDSRGELGNAAFDASFVTSGELGGSFRAFTNVDAVTATKLTGSTTGAWTMEALVNLDATQSTDFARISDSGEFRLRFEDGPQRIRLDWQGETFFSNALTVDTSKWYHAAWVYEGNGFGANDVKFYWTEMLAGNTAATQVGTATSAGTGTFVAGNFEIGSANGGQYDGLVDEFRISNVALAANQMMFGTLAPPSNGTPEPTTAVLALLGLVGVVGLGRRSRRRRS